MLETIAQIIGVKKSAIIVGLISSVVSLKFVPYMASIWQRLTMVGGGFCCAVFIAPGIAEAFEFKERTEHGIVFLVGLFGMSLCAALMQLITSGELWDFIKKKLGVQ